MFSVTLAFYYIFCWGTTISSVKINQLEVPELIYNGESAKLDCEFILDENDEDPVLKWFLNQTLVYQWIPESNTPPLSLGILKNRVELGHIGNSSTAIPQTTLYIPHVEPHLSGEYTCQVSTMESEDQMTKTMSVHDLNASHIHRVYNNLIIWIFLLHCIRYMFQRVTVEWK